ncbi:OmpA family protein, partial [bacterium]|nr:OmpA family protein [bacterium]
EVESENLGSIINSPSQVENCPVISDNETVLVFTAGKNNNFSPDLALELINADYEMDNIFFSMKEDTTWSKPRNIMTELGVVDTKTAPVTITGDGKTLYLVKDDNDDGNIYVSYYKDDKWTSLKKLGKNINTKDWESHATIVPDGSVMYFTSDKPGGYGGLDIYKSVLDENGEWGPPENLGPTINTEYDEETPFILNDEKTLYFSSQGHYSMGGFDVFHSRLLDDGKWSTPLNLGYPINTVGNDLFYLPKANGEYAFFPLNNNERGFGTSDIYRIQVVTPESSRPEITLKGVITLADKKNVLPKKSGVFMIDNTTLDTIEVIPPDINTGFYTKDITPGNFKLLYRAEGYLDREEFLFIPEIYTRKDVVINVELIPLEVTSGEYYVIRSIFFDYGKHDLRRESMIELEKLGKLMLDNLSLYVEIIGHTDSKSSAEFNQKLSERRSRAAIDYLVNMGVSVDRFVSKGAGESQFIAINENPDGSDNPEGRQLNRRVEVKILKSDNNLIIAEDIYVPPQLRLRKESDIYTILIVSSKIPLGKEYFASKDPGNILKDVKATNGESGILYTVGDYSKKSEALKLFNQIIEIGFEEATILDSYEFEELKAKELTADVLNRTGDVKQGDPVNSSGADTLFTIQLKALSKPVPMNYFEGLKGVKENLCDDGFYRYTYMEIADYEEAKALRMKVIEMGYPDAFIVRKNKFNKIEDRKGEFTIQIKAMKSPVNLGYFRGLEGVREYIGNDGWYKYTFGKFSSMEEAK